MPDDRVPIYIQESLGEHQEPDSQLVQTDMALLTSAELNGLIPAEDLAHGTYSLTRTREHGVSTDPQAC